VRALFDTNILVYAFSKDDRAEPARQLLSRGGFIGVQSLNEFANVAIRRLRMSWPETHESLAAIKAFCQLVGRIDLALHEDGIRLAERYRLQLFDAMIAAAALESDCDTLWSEDMPHGLVIDGRLTVRNPFIP
jgi:predicted nucleic acid-binding protein